MTTQPTPDPRPIAEIVTFTLLPGADRDAFAQAAAALDGLLAATPGFLGRCLSASSDGIWTDHVLWSDLAAASAAASALPAWPEAGAFLAAIDPASLTMRHDTVAHRQAA